MKGLCIVEGILLAIIGLLAIFNPISSFMSFALIIGILFIIYGVVKFFRLWKDEHKIIHIFMSIIDVLFGLIFMFAPLETASEFVLILGVWAIIRGIYNLIFAAKLKKAGLKFPIFYSIVTLIWGLLIVIFPALTLVMVAILPFVIGVYFIVIAISEIYIGFKL
ncbi:MAG: HdeD family acid-resistance protein [Sarcina sp.]